MEILAKLIRKKLHKGKKRGREGSRQRVFLESDQEGTQKHRQRMGVRRSSSTGYERIGSAGATTGRHRLADADSDQTEASSRRRNVLEIGKDLSYCSFLIFLIFNFLLYHCKDIKCELHLFNLFVLQGGDGQIRGEDHNERTPFANEPY